MLDIKEKGTVKEARYQRERHSKKGETRNATDDHETGPETETEGVFVVVERGHVGVTDSYAGHAQPTRRPYSG